MGSLRMFALASFPVYRYAGMRSRLEGSSSLSSLLGRRVFSMNKIRAGGGWVIARSRRHLYGLSDGARALVACVV